MPDILLSILVPTLFERWDLAAPLAAELDRQCKGQPAEILWLADNRRRTLGKKREALISAAWGTHLCHLDDDDWIAPDFVELVVGAIRASPEVDVVSYDQEARIDDGNPFRVRTSLSHEVMPAKLAEDGKTYCDILRPPWHWCVFRRELTRGVLCQDGNIDEDWHWLQQVLPLCKTETHLDRVLHYYRHDSKISVCKTNPTVGREGSTPVAPAGSH